MAIGVPEVLPALDGGTCVDGAAMPTCHNVHKRIFKLSNEWQQKQVLFKRSGPGPGWGIKAIFDPTTVISVQFDAAVPGANFEIQLDDVGLFK